MVRIATLGLLLVACGGGVKEVSTTPSGEKVYETKCKSDPRSCRDAALAKCSGGFESLSGESHTGGVAADLAPGPVTWYVLTFRCGGDSAPPEFVPRAPTGGEIAAGAAVQAVSDGAAGFNEGWQRQEDQNRRQRSQDTGSPNTQRRCSNDSECFQGEACVGTTEPLGVCAKRH